MKDYEAFALLKTDMVKDTEAVRKAYYAELPNHHPEEDPEGFKRLREAYEEALRYASTPEKSPNDIVTAPPEWEADTPVARIMTEITDIYTHYQKRIDKNSWEEVLASPEINDFDWEQEIRKAVFIYLSEHFRLPPEIWRLLDRTFFIMEREQEFAEFMPEGFLSFIKNRLAKESYREDFAYSALSGYPSEDKSGKIDAFIEEILNHECGVDVTKEWIDHMETFGMSHPWYSICKYIYLRDSGDTEGLLEKTRNLTAEYPKDIRLLCAASEIFYSEKDHDSLTEAYNKIIKTDFSRIRMGHRVFLLKGDSDRESGDLLSAFKAYEKAASVIYSKEVADRLPETSKELTALLLKKDDLSDEEGLILCQSCDVSGLNEEGVKYFREHPDRIQYDKADFCYWYACLYDGKEHLDEMDEKTEIYRQAIDTEYGEAVEEKDEEIKHKEEGRYYLLKSHVFILRASAEEDSEKRESLGKEALEQIDRAEEICPGLCDYAERRISVMFELEEYRKIVTLAEETLSDRPNDYYLLSALQAAYSKLYMYQEVVDLFYRARAVYDGDPSIYERACKAFRACGQYKDVKKVIDRAGEAGVTSEYLDAEREFALGMLTDGPEDEETWRKSIDNLLLFQREWSRKKEDEQDKEAIANANLYAGMLLMDKEYGNHDENYAEAEKLLDRAIEYFESEDAYFRRGRLYLLQSEAEKETDQRSADEHRRKACEYLDKAYELGYWNIWLCCTLSELLAEEGEFERAIEILAPAIADNEKLYTEYERLATWNARLFKQTQYKPYAEECFRYCSLYEEKVGQMPDIEYDRGECYFYDGDYEKAIEQYKKSLSLYRETVKEHVHPFFISMYLREAGLSAMKLGRYDEAAKLDREALETAFSPEYKNPTLAKNIMSNLVQSYLLKGDYKEGIRYFWDYRNMAEKELKDAYITEEAEEMLSLLVFSQGTDEKLISYHKDKLSPVSYIVYKDDAFDWWAATDKFRQVMMAHIYFPNIFTWAETKNVLRGAMSVADSPHRETDLHQEFRYLFMYYLGRSMFLFHADDEQAIRYLKQAEPGIKDDIDPGFMEKLYEALMWMHHFKGSEAAAGEYAGKYMEEAARTYPFCEKRHLSLDEALEEPVTNKKEMYFEAACGHLLMGNTEKAKYYADRMGKCQNCPKCQANGCNEYPILLAMIALYENDRDTAERYIRNVPKELVFRRNDLYLMLLSRMGNTPPEQT